MAEYDKPSRDVDEDLETSNLTKLGEVWRCELELAKREDKEWIERGKNIVKRYRAERPSALEEGRKFNILWSNVQTLLPAIYAKTPQAEVVRRNKDGDPVGRTASIVLERCLQYELDQYDDFDEAMRSVITDRLLSGRGTAWVRFEVETVDLVAGEAKEDASEAMDAEDNGNKTTDPEAIPDEADEDDETKRERAIVDYVYWEDFRCSPARVWAEVTWVARRIYLTKEEGKERFGAAFEDVPMIHEPIGLEELRDNGFGGTDELKKAKIWEIWDKNTRRVIWLAEGLGKALEVKEDPYGLDNFWPCPKPLYATQTSDTLTPVPDFVLYQAQARELDMLTEKIGELAQALKVAGLYDSSQKGIERLLTERNNVLVPCEDWASFAQQGGSRGAIDWMPIEPIVAALQQCYLAREQCKQVIYEITGISDIIRGATKASETATAQNIKRQFGSLRLNPRQREVAMFASEILRIKAQLMMDLYSPKTLADMSGIENTEDAERLNEALALMKTEPLRSYRVNVASDSLIELDQEQEKQSRVEFLQAAGGFLQQALPVAQQAPMLAPLMGEMLMFGVRAFKGGRTLEAAFEQAVSKLNEQAEQPQQQGPSEAEIMAQQEQAKMQAEMQTKQQQMQMDGQIAQMKMQMDAQAQQIRAQSDMEVQRMKIDSQAQLEQARASMQAQVDQSKAMAELQLKEALETQNMQFQRWKAELDAATKIQVASIASAAKGVIQINPATTAAEAEIGREIT